MWWARSLRDWTSYTRLILATIWPQKWSGTKDTKLRATWMITKSRLQDRIHSLAPRVDFCRSLGNLMTSLSVWGTRKGRLTLISCRRNNQRISFWKSRWNLFLRGSRTPTKRGETIWKANSIFSCCLMALSFDSESLSLNNLKTSINGKFKQNHDL